MNTFEPIYCLAAIGLIFVFGSMFLTWCLCMCIAAARDREHIIEDGTGNAWCAYCPKCGGKTMQVVSPGKVQCSECGI